MVLAAGALATPVLLMASGVGPSSHLSEHGITVVADSPTVGTLTDPSTVMFGLVGLRDEVLAPRLPAFLFNLGSGVTLEAFNGDMALRGLLASSCGFVDASQRTEATCLAAGEPLMTRTNLNQDISSVTAFAVKVMAPLSRGSVKLSSSSAEDAPIITTGYFSVDLT